MVSKAFMLDFAYCANAYKWSTQTVEEVKQQTRDNPELMAYWSRLAAAHRAGYEPCKANNWQRLECWEQNIAEAKRYENEYGRRHDDRKGAKRSAAQ